MTINRLKKILLLMWCNVVWDLAVQVFGEQERMALLHFLALVISSLLVVWIMEKVGMSIIVVLEKCGVSCLKKECDFKWIKKRHCTMCRKWFWEMRWIWGWLNELIKLNLHFVFYSKIPNLDKALWDDLMSWLRLDYSFEILLLILLRCLILIKHYG